MGRRVVGHLVGLWAQRPLWLMSRWSPPSCSLELLLGRELGFQSWEGPKEAQGQPLFFSRRAAVEPRSSVKWGLAKISPGL